jgi:hydrogenase/urease accessory protein HupE
MNCVERMVAHVVRSRSANAHWFPAARAFTAGLIFCCSARAAAHDADIIYLRVEKGAAVGEVVERATLSAGTLAQLVPGAEEAFHRRQLELIHAQIESQIWSQMPLWSGSVLCERGSTSALEGEGYVELSARFECPEGELKQTFKLLAALPIGYRVITRAEVRGERVQRFADQITQTILLSDRGALGERLAQVRGLKGWFKLGVAHIFGGLDHLAFLVALLIVGGGWKRILVMVTAFTVAHSVTLGATALDLITLDTTRQRWAEIAIAASIVYVAFENLALRQHDHRAWITFGFGLVHGFGFASVLKSYGLGDSRALGLLGFNLGVEVGQACIVLAIYPVVSILRRRPAASRWMVRLTSVLILSAGGYWLVDRVSS